MIGKDGMMLKIRLLYFFGAYAISFWRKCFNTTFMNGAGRLMDLIQNIKYANDKTIPLKMKVKKCYLV